MSLEAVILGWLETGPGSGYDLVRQMDRGLAWFWTASHSQIYPLLRRMEEDGLITSTPVTVGERQEKRVYEITDAGRDVVRAWAEQPVRYPPNRDVERLKLIFGDQSDLASLRRHAEEHRRHFRRRKEQLDDFYQVLVEHRHPRIERRVAAAQNPTRQQLVRGLREFAYRGDIARADVEIAWAEELLRWLDTVADAAGEDVPAVRADANPKSVRTETVSQ